LKTVQDYLNGGACDIAPLLSLVLGKSNTQLYAQNDYALGDKYPLPILVVKKASTILILKSQKTR